MAISAKDFLNKACKEVVIPGFEIGETITVKVKPVSLLGLASKGKIPNTLMGAVNKMFGKDVPQTDEEKLELASNLQMDMDSLVQMSGLLDVVCEHSLVEPLYEEVGDYLTDDQKNVIFEAAQGTVKDLMPTGSK